MKPLVSILIPIYNRIDLYSDSVESALSQDYENIEIIIVDNNSTDGTYEAINKKYGNNPIIKLYKNDSNIGPVGNWIQCLNKATGKYIKFLWSDDLIEKSFIKKTVSILETNENIAFAYTSVMRFHNTITKVPVKIDRKDVLNNYGPVFRFGKTGVYEKDFFIRGAIKGVSFPVSPGCAIIRKDCLRIVTDIEDRKKQIFSQTGAGPDLLMFLEALSIRPLFAFIDEPLSYFRWHNNSISIVDKRVIEGYIEARKYYVNKEKCNYLESYVVTNIIAKERHYKLFPISKSTSIIQKYYSDYNNTKTIRLLPTYCVFVFSKLIDKCKIRINRIIIKTKKIDYISIKTKWQKDRRG